VLDAAPGRREDGEMADEARAGHPDVDVTVRRVDLAPPPRRRAIGGARLRRPAGAALLAAAAIVMALLYGGAAERDAARAADANRRAAAAAKRATDFANVLALHERILAASRRTTRVYRAERGRMGTASARMRLAEAVVPLEGLAFVLRRGLAPIPRAGEIWQRYLVCAFYTARAGVGPALDRDVPELARFARARRPAIDVHACSAVALPARG
jgi:hypothetical protein